MSVLLGLLNLAIELFCEKVHPGLEDKLQIHVEVVNTSQTLVVLVVELVHVHLAKVICFELVRLLLNHVEDAIVL